MTAIIHADLELWLMGWLRAQLAARTEPVCQDVKVDNKEPLPGSTWPKRLVIVRDDGSTEDELNVDTAALGINVYAGTKVDDARPEARRYLTFELKVVGSAL